MALAITFYNNFSDNRTVNKNITSVMSGSVYLMRIARLSIQL
jgi:hypothetical protein